MPAVPTSDPNILLAALSRDIVEVDVAKGQPTGRVLATTPEDHGVGKWGAGQAGRGALDAQSGWVGWGLWVSGSGVHLRRVLNWLKVFAGKSV